MSKVHEALRKAEQSGAIASPTPAQGGTVSAAAAVPPLMQSEQMPPLHGLLEQIREIPFQPARGSHLLMASRTHEAPSEEFRSLRTRLNHMQGQRRLHTLLLTSASPAEGKSFSAANLALVESQLAGNKTLLCDFDFRRPVMHSLFGQERSPGITDYLTGKASLPEIIRKVAGSELYLMPAGEAVLNPLELLNLREVKMLLDQLPSLFNWVILDSPPLLFAADANLLATLCDGTLLVVRLGATTYDSVTRAIQSMSHNNIVGVMVNGASRSELYSKYTYYHSYYYDDKKEEVEDEEDGDGAEEQVQDQKQP